MSLNYRLDKHEKML